MTTLPEPALNTKFVRLVFTEMYSRLANPNPLSRNLGSILMPETVLGLAPHADDDIPELVNTLEQVAEMSKAKYWLLTDEGKPIGVESSNNLMSYNNYSRYLICFSLGEIVPYYVAVSKVCNTQLYRWDRENLTDFDPDLFKYYEIRKLSDSVYSVIDMSNG